MQTVVSVSLDQATLAAFDTWRAQRGLARGKAIHELLNLAAGAERASGRGVDGLFEGLPKR